MTRFLYNLVLYISVLRHSFARRRNIQKEIVKRILVVELTKLGDLVSGLPLLSALRRAFPQASISVMAQARYLSLLRAIPDVQKTITVSSPSSIKGHLQAMLEVRRQKYDLVLSASPSVRNGTTVLVSSGRYKCGYVEYSRAKVVHLQPHRVRCLGFQYTEAIDEPLENITERPGRLCKTLGIEVQNKMPVLETFRMDSAPQRRVLEELGLKDDRSYIVVHPFSSWEYRSWPVENLQKLLNRTLGVFNGKLVLVASEADQRRLESLRSEFAENSRVLFVIGRPLDELAYLIARAALFIGNDSGPLHLAAAVGIPSVGLFGPAPPRLTGPPIPVNSYLYKKVECSPCDQLDCVRKWAPCMSLISVEDVFEAMNTALIRSRNPSLRHVAWPQTV